MVLATRSPLSRRAALLRLAAGGLATGLAAGAATLAAGQESTPMSGGLPPVIQEWVDAWNAEDLDRLAALFAEDAVFEEAPTGVVATGPDEIRAAFEGTMTALSNLTVAVERSYAAGDWVVVEGTFGGTQIGSIGEISPTGQTFAVPFAAVFELEGDRIRREADYFDLHSVLLQLGVVLPPGAEGAPAATPSG